MFNPTGLATLLALAAALFFQSASAINTKCNVTIYAGEDYTGAQTIYGYKFKGTKSQAALAQTLPQAVKSLRLVCTVSPVDQRSAMLRVISIRLHNNAQWNSRLAEYPYQTGVYPNAMYTGSVPKISVTANSMAMVETYSGDITAVIFNKREKLVMGGVKA